MSEAILLYGSRGKLIEATRKLTPKLLVTSDFRFAEAATQDLDYIHIYDSPIMLLENLKKIIPQNINYIVIDLQGFTPLNYDLAVNIARRTVDILRGICIAGKINLIILSPARTKLKDGEFIGPAFPIHNLRDKVVKT